MSVSQLEKDLQTTKYIIEFREERIEKLKRKVTLSEREKVFLGEEEELLKALKRLDTSYQNGLDIELGKLPPQATDLEEAVLGACMLEKNAVTALAFLKPEHFYLPEHQSIWNAIRGLLLDNSPIDMRTVVMQLRRMGAIEEVGGAYKIAELTSKVSSAANVEYHARFIVEMAVKRKLIEMAGLIMAEGYKDTKDVFDLTELVEKEFQIAQEWLAK